MQHLKSAIHIGANKISYNPFTLRDLHFSILISNILTYVIDSIKRTLTKVKKKPNVSNNITAYKYWHLYRPKIESLLCPALIILATNSEFYKVFLKAEDAFCKLPNDVSMQTEFIDYIHQAITKPLLEPLKVPKTAIPKGHLLGIKNSIDDKFSING
ncbi:12085_t:CDS:2 [Cetraspora pellucida]|uniref:12085_t:CDS:1 n=1 Tax=Cetraspora pellucida TaxID=1433469 RepID=A0A9N9H7I8_9GLOM|nr:12085_t:CDS:2 [Cetraspora pellucida]